MMLNKKVLHLVLTYHWYDMIDSGIKKEEYREMTDYWWKRLTNVFSSSPEFKDYDVVRFRRGYRKEAKRMDFKISSINVGIPNPEWCWPTDESHFIISLGERLS